MKLFERTLNIGLPPGQSTFLWGPRKTGKSTYLKKRFPNSLVYDFLKTDLFLEFSRNPSLLREQLLAQKKERLQLKSLSQKFIIFAELRLDNSSPLQSR